MTHTILVVDDSPTALAAVTAVLQEAGYRTAATGDPLQALSMAAAADLIIIDAVMPGMDGFELCRKLRANPRTRFLPMIIATALTERKDRLAAIEAGADDFLVKPVDSIELTARVRSMLRVKDQRAELDRFRADFAAMLVHDLRSPLAGIIGLAESLASDPDPVQLPSALDIIARTGRNMMGLINDLLNVARMEGGGLQLHRRPRPVWAVMAKAAADLQAIADRRGIAVHLPPEVPWVADVDEDRLRQALSNLLDNALKAAASQVWMTLEPVGGHVRIGVRDDGPGVPPDALETMFEKWWQGRRSGGSIGTGLGLALVKLVVEAHGGRVFARLHPEGGFEVRCDLPAAGGGEPLGQR